MLEIISSKVPFRVTITRSPNTGTLYTLDVLIVTCETTFPHNPAVDVSLQVSHQWRKSGNVVSNDSRITISEVTQSGDFNETSHIVYRSKLTYASLLLSDSSTHICTSVVQLQPPLGFASPKKMLRQTSIHFTIGKCPREPEHKFS